MNNDSWCKILLDGLTDQELYELEFKVHNKIMDNLAERVNVERGKEIRAEL